MRTCKDLLVFVFQRIKTLLSSYAQLVMNVVKIDEAHINTGMSFWWHMLD